MAKWLRPRLALAKAETGFGRWAKAEPGFFGRWAKAETGFFVDGLRPRLALLDGLRPRLVLEDGLSRLDGLRD